MSKQQARLHDRILDTALDLAEASSWEQLRLHAVADALDISLDDIRRHYPQKDDLVEAWFDRADQAMLGAERAAGFPDLPAHERLQLVITDWLDALAPHRRLIRQMLAYKLEFGHLHLQALGIMRISRTVQWFREAAHQDSTGIKRIIDECTLTSIYLAAFARWLFDESANGCKSKAFLLSALRRCPGRGCEAGRQPPETVRSAEPLHPPGP